MDYKEVSAYHSTTVMQLCDCAVLLHRLAAGARPQRPRSRRLRVGSRPPVDDDDVEALQYGRDAQHDGVFVGQHGAANMEHA